MVHSLICPLQSLRMAGRPPLNLSVSLARSLALSSPLTRYLQLRARIAQSVSSFVSYIFVRRRRHIQDTSNANSPNKCVMKSFGISNEWRLQRVELKLARKRPLGLVNTFIQLLSLFRIQIYRYKIILLHLLIYLFLALLLLVLPSIRWPSIAIAFAFAFDLQPYVYKICVCGGSVLWLR